MKTSRKTPGATVEEREQYWERVIERARAYPGGVTEFCRVFKIRKNNYYQWFKRLKLKHPEWDSLTTKSKTEKARFVPVLVKTDEEIGESRVQVPKKEIFALEVEQFRIEIRMLGGHTIFIPPDARKEVLQMVLEALAQKS